MALRGYTDFNKMKYDRSTGLYRLSMPLKQGSYNYQYVVRPAADAGDSEKSVGGNFESFSGGQRRSVASDAALIEGNHYETVNEYHVYVYLRRPGSRADRLLGAATVVAAP